MSKTAISIIMITANQARCGKLMCLRSRDDSVEKSRQNVVRIFFPSRNKRCIVMVENGQNDVLLTINTSITKLKQCSTLVKLCFSNVKP
jgi:hypothetical protein